MVKTFSLRELCQLSDDAMELGGTCIWLCENTMRITRLRAIGKQRIEGTIGLINLSYNIRRYVQVA